jgi:hypothetical protein
VNNERSEVEENATNQKNDIPVNDQVTQHFE